MKPEVKNTLKEKIEDEWGKVSPEKIREEMGISKSIFYQLVGELGLSQKKNRIQGVTTVRWEKTQEGGSAPILRVSRRILRKLDLRDGKQVYWSIEDGKIIGTPIEDEKNKK